MIASAITWLLQLLAVPETGLTSVFIVSFVAATLLPLGSEPTVFAVIKANALLFWPVILLATAGNTLGGAVNYWLGYRAKGAFANARESDWLVRMGRHGPKTMLLAWLPIVGDPLCSLAGWFRLPFWSSLMYMAIGKLLRYLVMTILLLYVPDALWLRIGRMLV
ncbi:MAG: membrane protein YqaA with SNARE-associated domain [Janthinobacterium sp.]|jgi:membrane protein YqaA with SNARE-associated domain